MQFTTALSSNNPRFRLPKVGGMLLFLLVSLVSGGASSAAFVPVQSFANRIPNPAASLTTRNSPNWQQHNRNVLSIRGGQQQRPPSKTGTTTTTTAPLHVSVAAFDNVPFLQYNTIMVLANALGFVISVATKTQIHLDLVGTGAFALASIPSLVVSDIPRIQFSAAFVTLWGTKLASFLFLRALKIGEDKRLQDTLSTVSGTFFFWAVSLAWGVLCSLPHSLGITSNYDVPILSSPCSLAGCLLFVLGITIETTADVQKWIFKAKNPGQFCKSGLWSFSQHPNFLGNILLWTGIFLFNARALIEPPPAITEAAAAAAATGGAGIFQTIWRYRRLALALISPLMMYNFFSGQANGTISNSQELAMKKYGKDPEYLKYIETVPKIFPKLWK